LNEVNRIGSSRGRAVNLNQSSPVQPFPTDDDAAALASQKGRRFLRYADQFANAANPRNKKTR
jgi:hypothetical protein